MSDEQFYLSLLAVMTAVVAGAVLWMALLLHRNFLTIACDTAEFQNTIVNTLHGHWFRDTVIDGPNLLGMHTLFIFLLLIPVYTVCPYPEALFVVQVFAVYSTVIVLYFVALDFTPRPVVAFFVAASALASPLLVQMALAPFHPETWIAAATLATYHFYRRQKPLAFAICLIVGLTSGELAAFIYFSLGLALFLGEDGLAWRKRYGTWIAGVSAAWLILSLAVISPAVRVPEQQNLFNYHYNQWDVTSAAGLMATVLRQPVLAAKTLFDPQRLLYLQVLIGPMILLIFTSRTALLVAAVSFPIYFLMDDQEFYLYFHAYYFTFAFIAAYLGGLFFIARRGLDRWAAALLTGVYCLNVVLLIYSMAFYFQLFGGLDETFSRSLRNTFAQIPLDAAVYAPHRYSAYLSNRPNMVMGDMPKANVNFDDMVEAEYNKTTVHSSQIDYIVSDFWTDQCGYRRGFMSQDDTERRANAINKLIASGKWQVYWHQDDVVILQRATGK